MDLTSSIILGITQGLTEFLPISSSGHLIIVRDLLGIQIVNGLAFDAVLQLATTLAVLVYFRKDLFKIFINFFKIVSGKVVEKSEKVMVYALIIGTIPAVIFGLILEDFMDTTFRSTGLVAVTLVLGALVMFFAERASATKRQLSIKNGFFIGLFQALALIPGMSRSGMTIAGGLFNGLSREMAIKFGFILAFPILFGSGLKKLMDLGSTGLLESFGFNLMIGSIVSFAVGLAAIWFLVKYLKTHTLKVFVVYRILLAVVLLLFI
ncbi:MAG: undecaprenyl-diphosphatase [Candidatus Paceibacteria bacterium]|jgi:undecaprenyl-diphosphatase